MAKSRTHYSNFNFKSINFNPGNVSVLKEAELSESSLEYLRCGFFCVFLSLFLANVSRTKGNSYIGRIFPFIILTSYHAEKMATNNDQ